MSMFFFDWVLMILYLILLYLLFYYIYNNYILFKSNKSNYYPMFLLEEEPEPLPQWLPSEEEFLNMYGGFYKFKPHRFPKI